MNARITAVEELQAASRIMTSAGSELDRAAGLLDHVSESLADQLISTLSLLDDCNDRVKRAIMRVESA